MQKIELSKVEVMQILSSLYYSEGSSENYDCYSKLIERFEEIFNLMYVSKEEFDDFMDQVLKEG